MITPKKTIVAPNAVYASHVGLGMEIKNGEPIGVIRNLTLQNAVVDAEGKWTKTVGQGNISSEIKFRFDATGNVIGLPADLESLAPQVADIWGRLVTVIESVNEIRELV